MAVLYLRLAHICGGKPIRFQTGSSFASQWYDTYLRDSYLLRDRYPKQGINSGILKLYTTKYRWFFILNEINFKLYFLRLQILIYGSLPFLLTYSSTIRWTNTTTINPERIEKQIFATKVPITSRCELIIWLELTDAIRWPAFKCWVIWSDLGWYEVTLCLVFNWDVIFFTFTSDFGDNIFWI